MLHQMQHMIQEQRHCVLATSRDNRPHCSLMAYAASPDSSEIYLITHLDTRKYANLQVNPAVSLLIDSRGDDASTDPRRALTITGRLAPAPDATAEARIRHRFLQRHPDMAAFVQDPRARWLCIRVTTLQLLNGPSEAHHVSIEAPGGSAGRG
jgi:nitroimidazol reductase NimA-like FMN-containing flavoprotein (pyridoxamine 5'-phosphate oxidase superfamily)